jgi:cytosine/adenosine deaminase-related metal-dependent hydrolase
MAILGPDWGAWEVVEHDIRMAREFDLVSSSHTRRREDCVVPDGYKRMAREGLLGPDHNLVHGTSYDTADLRVVVDNGASLTSTVLVELEMQAALLFARGKEVRNNALRGNSPFKSIPVRSREALEWATVNGAKAFRLDRRIGTLSPGKQADIVMLRANDINMVPVWDPVYSIVEIAGAGNVDTVIIDGEFRKKDGKLTFPADVLRKRIAELTESGARIMREGGYKVATAPN